MTKSALPKGWPHPTEADLAALPQRIVNVGNTQDFCFCHNSIKTSKYELWNFLPKFLLEEFNPKTKVANCYFLLIASMQCINEISNTDGYPTVLIPLFVVLVIAGVFKALEDIARHRADTKANSSYTEVYDKGSKKFKDILWSEVKVGDYVKVKSREIVPADVIILQVSEPNAELPKGICYVETKSLDGETNLKMRNLIPILLAKVKSSSYLDQLSGKVEMEHPNNLIDNFTGVLSISNDTIRAPVQPNNVILRGCVLRSTDWMVGLVVNTGHDVKIMQSNVSTKIKSSNLEKSATSQVVGVILLLFAICITGSVGQAIFNYVKHVGRIWYLHWDMDAGEAGVIKFFYMLLLHASFIPVSLYVSMAMVRFFQSFFMQSDQDMYYEKLNAPMVVRTMTLNEELGQISHIFSDKTGTLTCNNMNFRKASIHGVKYGKGITEIGRAAWKLLGKPVPAEVLEAEELATMNSVAHVSFYCPDYVRDMSVDLNDMGLDLADVADESKTNGSAAGKSAGGRSKDPMVKINSGIRQDPFYFGGPPNVVAKQPSASSSAPAEASSKKNPAVQKMYNQEFYRYIAVCHEVVAEKLDGGQVKLSAPNPDDEALVCAAKYFGYDFQDRHDRFVQIYDEARKKRIEIEVLYTIPFTSARKRMSVIIRDVDRKIKIVTKGADTMMFSIACPADREINQVTSEHINQFSIEGLRCLVVAASELSEEEFAVWSRKYDEANTDLKELEKKKRHEPNDIENLENEIERNLHVIGATAIEDRLQDGVPECVEMLSKAGIKIWVLTGDKEETAINIAVACNLVAPSEYMKQVIINPKIAKTPEVARTILTTELKKFNDEILSPAAPAPTFTDMRNNSRSSSINSVELYEQGRNEDIDYERLPAGVKPRALIIDGPSLITIMKDAKTKLALLNFSQTCKAVVCCRVSPDQKREIVDMIKLGVKGVRTLAVGDGANDVAMITAAHVGVGIKGEEGVQAVNASDYAIAQFRYLSPLILKHGRFNYVRMSSVICYMFYKNVYMSSCMFWFSFVNAFSSQKYFTEAAIQLFNLFYTSVPILLYGAMDMDVGRDDYQRYPQLYLAGIYNKFFNGGVFWWWVSNGLIEGVLSSILPLYFLTNMANGQGTQTTFHESGALCFTSLVIIINLKLFMIQSNWVWFHWAVLLLSIGSWIGVAYIVSSSYTIDFDFYFVFSRLLKTGYFWLSLLVICMMVCLKDMVWMYVRRQLFYEDYHLLQEMNEINASSAASSSKHARVTSKYKEVPAGDLQMGRLEKNGSGIVEPFAMSDDA